MKTSTIKQYSKHHLNFVINYKDKYSKRYKK